MRSPVAKREARVERAKARTAVAGERSLDDRLLALVARGHGHCAEARRIAETIAAATEPSRGRSAP